MAVTVRVPTTLRPLTAGASEVAVDGATLAEVLESLESSHPGFRDRILDEARELRRVVDVYNPPSSTGSAPPTTTVPP